MVSIAYGRDSGEARQPPDIFKAAAGDNTKELALALQEGQSFDDVQLYTLYTPIHVACLYKSRRVLSIAMDYDFNPWHRDCNQRLAIDHARAKGLQEFQKRLFYLMYPERNGVLG